MLIKKIINYLAKIIIVLLAGLGTMTLTFNFIILSDQYNGLYNSVVKGVWVKIEDRTTSSITETIHHEVGHYIWDNCIDKEDKTQFDFISTLPQCYRNFTASGYMIWQYLEEDFAETYSDYMMDFGMCPEKRAYYNRLSYKILRCNNDKN